MVSFRNHSVWETWGITEKNAYNIKTGLLPMLRTPKVCLSEAGEESGLCPAAPRKPEISRAGLWPCLAGSCYKEFFSDSLLSKSRYHQVCFFNNVISFLLKEQMKSD